MKLKCGLVEVVPTGWCFGGRYYIMAGEFEEPFAISFQADALHSGSVSFGRFEKEELAWERRSSFSHNRYLEEVGKYSKPGSVVEKKAYFEAHFKKKGMLVPDTSGVEYAREHRGSYNGSLESGDHEEDDDHLTGDGSDCCSDTVAPANNGGFWSDYEVAGSGRDDDPVEPSPDDDDHGLVEAVVDDLRQEEARRNTRDDLVEAVYGGGSQFQNTTDSNHSGRYSQSEVVGIENDNDLTITSVEGDAHNAVESVVGGFKHAEARGSTQDEPCWTDDRPEENAANQNQSLKTTGESEKHGNARAKVDRTSASQRRNLSPKTRAATDRTTSKFTLKVSAKIQNHNERDQSLQGTKVQKQLQERPLPTKSPLLRVPQKIVSISNTRAKFVSLPDGSALVVPAQQSAKSVSGSSSTENRFDNEQIASSNNPSEKPNPPGFSFKSEERAERRKQFYTKLEEKLHAKEAEMNQVQARTQEKTEAEMKRFRRSLNFKATPMPSFYHHPTQQIRSGNKADSSNLRLVKVQNKSAVQGNGNAKQQPSHKAANKSVAVRNSTSTTDNLPALQITSNDSIREAARKIGSSKGKAGPEKVNDQSSSSSSRHVQLSGKNIGMSRIEMAERKQQAGGHRSSKKMASKSTDPGIGHRVSGVAL